MGLKNYPFDKPLCCTNSSHTAETSTTLLINSCLVAKLCPTLCDPMKYGTFVFPVIHCLPKFAQTHVHWISDVIQLTHPLPPPSLPALNLSSIRIFSNELALHIRWSRYWSFSISPSTEYSGLISFRIGWFDVLAVQGDSQESSPAPQFKSINSLVLSLFYGPTLTSVPNYWKNCTEKLYVFPGGSDGKVPACNEGDLGSIPGFDPWVRKMPWRRKCQSTPILLPGKFHGQRSLVGYSPWGCKELDTTERLHFLSLRPL